MSVMSENSNEININIIIIMCLMSNEINNNNINNM